jgi:hypothetical protein
MSSLPFQWAHYLLSFRIIGMIKKGTACETSNVYKELPQIKGL